MTMPGGGILHAPRFAAWVAQPAGEAVASGRFRACGCTRKVATSLLCRASATSAASTNGASHGYVKISDGARSAPPTVPEEEKKNDVGWQPYIPEGPPKARTARPTSLPACYTPDDVECAMRYAEDSAVRLVALVNCYSALAFNVGDVVRGSGRYVPLGLARQAVAVDFSRAEPLPRILADALRIQAVRMVRKAESASPLEVEAAARDHPAAIEQQNRAWFLSHCQAVRDGSLDDQLYLIDGVLEKYSGLTVLANDYADEDMCFQSAEGGSKRHWLGNLLRLGKDPEPKATIPYELCCWALAQLAQNGTEARPVITWPTVAFEGERVFFEWAAFSPSVRSGGRLSLLAYGDVLLCRAGDKGRIYKKISERTNLACDIFTDASRDADVRPSNIKLK